MNRRLVDTHCHLMLDQFQDDLGQVLARAQKAGVSAVLVPGIDLDSSQSAVEMADSHPALFAAVGVHPHHAHTWTGEAEAELTRLADSGRVVAIGEIGLDFYRDYSPRAAQRRAFRDQLDLAKRLALPIVVHNRDAIDEILEELESWTAAIPDSLRDRPGVLHAFSGDESHAQRALEMGFYLGVGGPITFKNAGGLRHLTSSLPLDRLMVETDAPYLSPHPHRGERNEPAYLPLVADGLAQTLSIDFEQVAQATTRNAKVVFEWNHGTDNGHLL